MVYKNLNLLTILSLLIFSVNRIIYGQQFTPGPRTAQAAILVGDKIYYIGGNNYESVGANTESDFFYIGGPDRIWVDLESQGVQLPSLIWHTLGVGGAGLINSIFIIGGDRFDETSPDIVFRFDTNTNTLSTSSFKRRPPPRRIDMKAVSHLGKIYTFGGRMI